MPMSEYALRHAIPKTARDLIAEHGLDGWTFAWTKHKTIRGQCSYRDREIRYSENFLASPLTVIYNTLLHEIAHAIAGPGHHHDGYWRSIAKKIGCTGERCSEGHVETVAYRWTLRCEPCGRMWQMHRLSSKAYRYRCPTCESSLSITDNNRA